MIKAQVNAWVSIYFETGFYIFYVETCHRNMWNPVFYIYFVVVEIGAILNLEVSPDLDVNIEEEKTLQITCIGSRALRVQQWKQHRRR